MSRIPRQRPFRNFIYPLLNPWNQLLCRAMYHVRSPSHPPLPQNGPVLLVSDHSSFCDPMVLAATAGRPIIFLTAREVYEAWYIHWFCKTLHYIPVSRGTHDIGAVRSMLRALQHGEVIALFPEGGINLHRVEDGHLGIGYLALKTGAPVVPASITWNKTRPPSLARSILTPGNVHVRYGKPMVIQSVTQPDRESIEAVTSNIMRAIRDLKNHEPCVSHSIT